MPTRGASVWRAITRHKLVFAASLFLALVSIIALLAPIITPETYSGFDQTQGGLHPHIGWRYLLGTDVFGHSMVAYLILGARTTVGIGLLATAIALALGGVVGVAAGVLRGWVDLVVMTVVQVVLTVPFLVLLLILVAYQGGSDPVSVAALFGIVGAFYVAQLVRNGCMREIRRQSVDAAKASGASGMRILLRHVLPGLPGSFICAGTLVLTAMMAAEATVDFLGLGVSASTMSWGTALSLSLAYITGGFWWWYVLPGLALVATLLAITIVGNALSTAFTAPPHSVPNGVQISSLLERDSGSNSFKE